jgi:hypothetical protein
MYKQELKKHMERLRSRCIDLERERPLFLQEFEGPTFTAKTVHEVADEKRQLTQRVITNPGYTTS